MGRFVQTWTCTAPGVSKTPGLPNRVSTLTKMSHTSTGPSIDIATLTVPLAPVPFPTEDPAAASWAFLYPLIQWEDLDPIYSTRNLNTWAGLPDMSVVLRRATQRCYVELPMGFRGKLVDFKSAGTSYSCYAPNIMGMWCRGGPYGDNGAVIRIEPYTSTVVGLIPPQPVQGAANGDGKSNPFTLMRLGPTNDHTFVGVHNYGWALGGTNQPDSPAGLKPGTFAHPHNYSGLNTYMGTGSTDTWMCFFGIQGDWNSPPGETFSYQTFRAPTQNIANYIEVNGFNEAGIASGGPPTAYYGANGTRVGGGVGNNGSENATYTNCYFHDMFVSGGPIYSGAGGPDGFICNNSTTVDCRSWNNANNTYPDPGGRTFGGYNHEGISGEAHYTRPNIKMGPFNSQHQKEHFFFGGWLGTLTKITIIDAVVPGPQYGSPAGTYVTAVNGCIVIKIPKNYAGRVNTQNADPSIIFVYQNGVRLTPLIRNETAGQGWPSGGNPALNYILVV